MQWLEFLYYIEPITKASTERTKFGPLLWTKLKQQVLLTPLTQETLYYLSAFWWTRQLREVTGFPPRQEIFAVTFNHVCGKEKKATPQHLPNEAECKQKNLSSIESVLQGGFFSYLCFAWSHWGPSGKVFIFLFHPNSGKKSSNAPRYHHSLTRIFCASFLLLGQHIKGKKKSSLFCSLLI